RIVTVGVVIVSAFVCVYAAVNVAIFETIRSFLSYPLLELVGDVGMLRSSFAAQMKPVLTVATFGAPTLYVVAVVIRVRRTRGFADARWRPLVALPIAAIWITMGQRGYAEQWAKRDDKRISDNATVAPASSWWQAEGSQTVSLADALGPDGLSDFEPV